MTDGSSDTQRESVSQSMGSGTWKGCVVVCIGAVLADTTLVLTVLLFLCVKICVVLKHKGNDRDNLITDLLSFSQFVGPES